MLLNAGIFLFLLGVQPRRVVDPNRYRLLRNKQTDDLSSSLTNIMSLFLLTLGMFLFTLAVYSLVKSQGNFLSAYFFIDFDSVTQFSEECFSFAIVFRSRHSWCFRPVVFSVDDLVPFLLLF